jgi:indole-3-glycerol phosphate synthase
MQKSAATILEQIIFARRQRVEQARSHTSIGTLQQAVKSRTEFRDFAAALSGGGVRVIAEMKKASPSAGLLRQNYRCCDIAKEYEGAGAVALSVVTEEDYFQGSLADLQEARAVVRLPVLRKDFVVDVYQVYESAAAGADALLLIAATEDERELRSLLEVCEHLKIAPLVESHTEEELNRALAAGARIIGVNNRNLKTLEVSLETSLKLREMIPASCLTVSESGIRTAADLRILIEAGYNAALVGEWFMSSDHPGRALAELLAGAKSAVQPPREAKLTGGKQRTPVA